MTGTNLPKWHYSRVERFLFTNFFQIIFGATRVNRERIASISANATKFRKSKRMSRSSITGLEIKYRTVDEKPINPSATVAVRCTDPKRISKKKEMKPAAIITKVKG